MSLYIVIIEDEPVIARNLASTLNEIDSANVVIAALGSVAEAVRWFTANQEHYDLVFMDIRLADGVSFDIFKQVEIIRPIIFVTAYNDYAIQAFKSNGIGYILKPFDPEEIAQALQKYHQLVTPAGQAGSFAAVLEQINRLTKAYKRSFLIHYRDKLVPVETAKIAWFYTAHEIVYAHTGDGQRYTIEQTMEQLEQQLDPALFFRANRQFIINRNKISEVAFYFNGRLSVKVMPEPPEHILISKARVPVFKRWMDA